MEKIKISSKGTTTYSDGYVELSSVCAIETISKLNHNIFLYGGQKFIVESDINELLDDVDAAKLNAHQMRSTDPPEEEEFDLIVHGEYKFKLNICKYLNADSQFIKLYSNFIINDPLRLIIQSVNGVENDMGSYNFHKYQTPINIGLLFDIYDVRSELEQAIKDYLEI